MDSEQEGTIETRVNGIIRKISSEKTIFSGQEILESEHKVLLEMDPWASFGSFYFPSTT